MIMRLSGEPCLDLGCLVDDVVVHDDMNIEPFKSLPIGYQLDRTDCSDRQFGLETAMSSPPGSGSSCAGRNLIAGSYVNPLGGSCCTLVKFFPGGMADLGVRSQVRKAKMSPLTSLAFRTLVQQRAKQSGGRARTIESDNELPQPLDLGRGPARAFRAPSLPISTKAHINQIAVTRRE
jgi:hypothetical protein